MINVSKSRNFKTWIVSRFLPEMLKWSIKSSLKSSQKTNPLTSFFLWLPYCFGKVKHSRSVLLTLHYIHLIR